MLKTELETLLELGLEMFDSKFNERIYRDEIIVGAYVDTILQEQKTQHNLMNIKKNMKSVIEDVTEMQEMVNSSNPPLFYRTSDPCNGIILQYLAYHDEDKMIESGWMNKKARYDVKELTKEIIKNKLIMYQEVNIFTARDEKDSFSKRGIDLLNIEIFSDIPRKGYVRVDKTYGINLPCAIDYFKFRRVKDMNDRIDRIKNMDEENLNYNEIYLEIMNFIR